MSQRKGSRLGGGVQRRRRRKSTSTAMVPHSNPPPCAREAAGDPLDVPDGRSDCTEGTRATGTGVRLVSFPF